VYTDVSEERAASIVVYFDVCFACACVGLIRLIRDSKSIDVGDFRFLIFMTRLPTYLAVRLQSAAVLLPISRESEHVTAFIDAVTALSGPSVSQVNLLTLQTCRCPFICTSLNDVASTTVE
jgi:hypothetical protein